MSDLPANDESREHGPQPLDAVMLRWGLTHAALVAGTAEQLTHKQVRRARNGRRLTLHMMMKITRLLNDAVRATLKEEQRASFTPYLHRELFNYAKGHDPGRGDPNAGHAPPAP